jgi:hypothetical protein
VLTAQTKYDAKWKRVDSLINGKGLTESALTAVNGIYVLARRENNDPQAIRALIYKTGLQSLNRQDAETGSIRELDTAILTARQPARSILQSLQAGVYWAYFQQNRWKFYSRTQTSNFVKSDPATWTTGDFHKKIGELYQASLREEKLLQSTRLEAYEPILLKGNTRHLRPTLYDLLAHQALDYFKTSEQDITRPAFVFEIDDPAVFGDATAYAHHLFRTEDSLSLHFVALRLFQQLIRLHLSDPAPDALLDVDIERLGFAKTYSVPDNKDSLYRRALARLTDRYGMLPAAAQAWFLQAERYASSPGEDTAHNGNVLAREICERVLTEKDSSEGRANCEALLHRILQQQLTLEVEKVNIPNQPMRCLVSWRNFNGLYLHLVRLDSSGQRAPSMDVWQKDYWTRLLGLPVYRSWSVVLPPAKDYEEHHTEIAISSLPVGGYALIGSSTPGWQPSEGVITVQYLYVSSIAYINQGRDYFVVNRESGQPLAGAAVQVWQQVYNNMARLPDLVKEESYVADQQGYFRIAEQDLRHFANRLLEIHIPNDHLFQQDAMVPNFFVFPGNVDSTLDRAAFEKKNAHVFFFLDRGIYRPGQTVYFKGIAVTYDYDTRKLKIFQGYSATVDLFNTNGEKLSTQELATNEFGSFHGTFRLPENGLNGKFRIADEPLGTGQYFSVEEYKRPKFYVEFEKQKGSYRIGDSIRVTGDVKGYAGEAIGGAKIRYRVVRNARFPNYWLFWRNRQPSSPTQEIAHGEIRTGADGKFHFVYLALPDRSVPVSSDPEFSYNITADVTDIDGETRSGSTLIPAAYRVFRLAVDLPGADHLVREDHLAADGLKGLSLAATNLSGQPVASRVHIAIYPLQAPGRLIRKRLWQEPDRFVLSEKEFLDSFPHDEYRQETKKESWARGARTWDTVAVTADTGSNRLNVPIPGSHFVPGWYVIEASTTDVYGQPVSILHYVELYDGKTGKPGSPQYNWAATPAQTADPGGKVRVTAGSSAKDVFVYRKIERKDAPVYPVWSERPVHLSESGEEGSGTFSYVTLNGERKTTEWAITEKDRGGFGILDAFVKDNRLYTQSSTVHVPWTDKELEISYETYRDKTLPGSEEKWQVKISGYRKEQVSAEVLTAMYDASLDQFAGHYWMPPYLYPSYVHTAGWQAGSNFQQVQSQRWSFDPYQAPVYVKEYDRLLPANGREAIDRSREVYAWGGGSTRVSVNGRRMNMGGVMPLQTYDSHMKIQIRGTSPLAKTSLIGSSDLALSDQVVTIGYGTPKMPAKEEQLPEISVRKNFNETAFFFPDLRTDSAGNLRFSFTMPEALTTWKWMTLAHTRAGAFGYSVRNVITRKQLMVQPNAPRFLREGDRIELSVKVSNMTDSEMTGQMSLQLTDPTTGQTADGWFVNRQPNQYFTVAAGQSAVVVFPLDIPLNYSRPLTYRVVAQAGNYSDGEEATLPVVSNRVLVTETLPLNMRGDGTRHFTMDKLLQSGSSETLSQHALTVEFTANPAWYAVQALPYLMEYPYECAEQTFNRFYANALATKILSSSPRLRQVFDTWRTKDTAALLSNLQKNQELKSILLEETPWVMQGKSEAQQKKSIALLFDMNLMSHQLEAAFDKLKAMQSSAGGFVWFKGGPDDRYMTQYILTGLGHLQKLNAWPSSMTDKINEMVKAALPYLDAGILEDYKREMAEEGSRQVKAPGGTGKRTGSDGAGAAEAGRAPKTGAGSRWMGELPVQYLYMRSLFSDYGLPGNIFPAMNYYRKQAQKLWVQGSKYMQGMIALALFRTGDVQTARDIIASLRQNAIRDEEMGMYWKGMEGGYYWYQAPVETQSLLIEAFHEISGDAAIERDLKTWLLKQKQTQSWPTTKATADACYALLLNGTDWLNAERSIRIRLGDKTITWPEEGDANAIGNYKKVFDGPFVNPSMGNIDVTLRTLPDREAMGSSVGGPGSPVGGSPAWGAVYWQYFDNMDRITPPGDAKAPLKLVKKLFIERNTDRGPVLEPLAENGTLKVGDKVRVRIELQADRDLEYVHMKDMRAACMEPTNVLSQYKWQGGLGYYESTKDASTDFFFSTLHRGTYVFEYSLFTGQAGNFSNGVTSIECMYAPEFAFHSEGIRVNVEAAN